ncbi:TIGR00730 family Rossman fold protein [Candidatus Poribacteria bacterium]|nr:MAG: TIGR00730 family Rossman fold protein [Candidatus Poribacteria bacterium]
MKRVCVFCGSSMGSKPAYAKAARQLGHALASRNLGLVYGGTDVGTMGELANAALEGGGEVIGVVPKIFIERAIAHDALSDLRVVDAMHERKGLMAELSDAFIALPGGLGTIDEIFEMVTWTQLGIHRKPCGLLNVCGYYRKLVNFLDYAVSEGFIKEPHRSLILIDESPDVLLKKFDEFLTH